MHFALHLIGRLIRIAYGAIVNGPFEFLIPRITRPPGEEQNLNEPEMVTGRARRYFGGALVIEDQWLGGARRATGTVPATATRISSKLLAVAALGAATAVHADSADYALETITVVSTSLSGLDTASAGDVSRAQITYQPLLRPAAVLENVPGLIVTQHSGEGKANQYFMRAFNLDHGTDLATNVGEMPINMPTHAHGQGYTDLNFLIPELVANLHYQKGPYNADQGDFATAGSVRIGLVTEAPSTVTAGYGEDGYRRVLLLGSEALRDGTLLGAGELYHNDGPFDVPDAYNRLNGVLTYRRGDERDYWSLTGMAYSGRWNSTDQVPARAITEGLIGRFGSLNPTDGGDTHRASLSFSRVVHSDTDQVRFSAYAIRYKLDLWSTFTEYLQDPIFGDQILQHDDRMVYGVNASKTWFAHFAAMPMSTVFGIQARMDDIRDVGIFPTYQREIIGTRQNAGVQESNVAAYLESSLQWRPGVRSMIALREDHFDFNVKDKLVNPNGSCDLHSDPLGCNTGSKSASIFSPKVGLILGPWAQTTYFIDAADGYHSNDARGITRSGQNPDDPRVTPLTRAIGMEVGLTSTAIPNLQTALDVFELKLASELVFEGDAGVTSPSGSTTRTGFEWGTTYQVNRWLSAELNAALSRARFDHEAPPDDLGCAVAAASNPCARGIGIVGRYVPNSPTNVIGAGVAVQRASGWFGALHARHFGESPLVEDGSARSPAYTTVDAQVGYRRPGQWLVALDVFNLFDVNWNDIEYYYVSRLRNETSPKPDYVVHPGVPRTVRVHFQYFLGSSR
jgi:outer membrane receptor protein involved in Fe transport